MQPALATTPEPPEAPKADPSETLEVFLPDQDLLEVLLAANTCSPITVMVQVDPSLSPLEACVRYSLSDVPLQSTAFLRSIPHAAQEYGFKNTFPRLLAIIDMSLQRDQPDVRSTALAQLAPLSTQVDQRWLLTRCQHRQCMVGRCR